jgi:hypothetical protein
MPRTTAPATATAKVLMIQLRMNRFNLGGMAQSSGVPSNVFKKMKQPAGNYK